MRCRKTKGRSGRRGAMALIMRREKQPTSHDDGADVVAHLLSLLFEQQDISNRRSRSSPWLCAYQPCRPAHHESADNNRAVYFHLEPTNANHAAQLTSHVIVGVLQGPYNMCSCILRTMSTYQQINNGRCMTMIVAHLLSLLFEYQDISKRWNCCNHKSADTNRVVLLIIHVSCTYLCLYLTTNFWNFMCWRSRIFFFFSRAR